MLDYDLELSVVIPVYNEYGNLKELTRQIKEVLAKEVNSFEIVYIDDGSRDGSSEMLDELANKNSEVIVYHFSKNNGQTAAFAAGFNKANGSLIATMDADLQVDPADLPSLISHIDKFDMVVGIRKNRQDTIIKKVSSKIGNGVRNLITREEIEDTGCPLKLFRSEVVKDLYLYKGMHRFFPTLAKTKGYTVKEVPVSHFTRQHGKSKYGIRNRMWKGLVDTLAVRWMQSRNISYKIKEEDN